MHNYCRNFRNDFTNAGAFELREVLCNGDEKVSDNDSQDRLIATRSAKCDNGSFSRFPDLCFGMMFEKSPRWKFLIYASKV